MPEKVLQRIVCVRTDRLGETVLTLPAVAAIKSAMPSACVTLVVHLDLQELLGRCSAADRVVSSPDASQSRWWLRALRLWRWLRREGFDAAVIFNPKKEWHVAVWMAAIPMRIGYDRKWGALLTHRLPSRERFGNCHEVERNLNLASLLSGKAITAPPLAFDLETPRAEVKQLLDQQGSSMSYIVVHSWTSNPRKQWPANRFQELVSRLSKESGRTVVLIGGAEASAATGRWLRNHGRVIDLVGRTSLPQLAALLGGACVLVSNDSGPVHLAAAVGTPVVALFGTTDPATGPQRWGPWGQGHTMIWKPSMEAITLDEVLAAVRRYVS
ncbi:MAG: glycosyltransferase family 9 protein [Candidatus Omnitrophica bacterium]|nr:glycosyltransferase family 9 protein [Candidatus Omnitrophota bacterium]